MKKDLQGKIEEFIFAGTMLWGLSTGVNGIVDEVRFENHRLSLPFSERRYAQQQKWEVIIPGHFLYHQYS